MIISNSIIKQKLIIIYTFNNIAITQGNSNIFINQGRQKQQQQQQYN